MKNEKELEEKQIAKESEIEENMGIQVSQTGLDKYALKTAPHPHKPLGTSARLTIAAGSNRIRQMKQ